MKVGLGWTLWISRAPSMTAVTMSPVALIWKVPAAHRMVPFRYCVDLSVWRGLIAEAVPLTLGAAFVTLYYRIDSVMLSKLDGFEAAMFGADGVIGAAPTGALVIDFGTSLPDSTRRIVDEVLRSGDGDELRRVPVRRREVDRVR